MTSNAQAHADAGDVAAPALELRDITKWFGSLAALRDVNFAVRPGTLHALLGENGAGKSTLMHIAYGMLRPELGSIKVDGETVRFRSPRDARAAGIGMVHQHPTSIDAMTVMENVSLAVPSRELRVTSRQSRVTSRESPVASHGSRVTRRGLGEWVAELSADLGLPLDPDARVESLSIALKQRLEIVKAIAGGARLLLLDEPTAVLAPPEAADLMSVVRAYVAHGNSAVLITHKLTEALDNAEEVTVLRRGHVTFRGRPDETNAIALADAMVGGLGHQGRPAHRPVRAASEPPRIRASDLVLRRNLGQADQGGRSGRYVTALRDRPDLPAHHVGQPLPRFARERLSRRAVELEVRVGEIVGLAAVEGNGQRELLRTIAGLVPPWSGLLDVDHPIAFIPEDRTTEALVPELTLTENVVLGDAPGAEWRVDWDAAERRTAELLRVHQVRARGPGARAQTLSGGNQQKLILARALELDPRVLVAENPTRGLDVAAANTVHERLAQMAEAGGAVLFHSTDLDEVLERSHRVLVMHKGELIPVPSGADREHVGRLMLGAP